MSFNPSQNNFNIDAIAQDWYAGVGQEFESTWGMLPQFKGDVIDMKFRFAQLCWVDSDPYAMHTRRKCVQAFGEKIFDNPNNSPRFVDWWNFFGVDSVSPKLHKTVCTLYNNAPYREFSKDDTGQQEALTDLYQEYKVNSAFKTAYKYAYFVNCVVLLPDFKTKKIQVLPSDMFRFLGPELWYIKYEYDDKGQQQIRYHVWDATEHKVVDAGGKLLQREENIYKRIPATILKLNPDELYGAGVSEAAEINVWQNMINFFSTKIGVNQSHSILVGRNIDKDAIKNQYLGAGAVITFPGVTGDKDPALEYITPQNFIAELEANKQKRVRQFERDQGLPGFLVDEGAGQPPTGAALQVLERTLNDYRKDHKEALAGSEQDFAELLVVGTNLHDPARSLAIGKFSIQYSDVETFNDPQAEFAHDQSLKGEGLISPSAYVQKYTNQRMSDEDAVKFMNANKSMFAGKVEPEVV